MPAGALCPSLPFAAWHNDALQRVGDLSAVDFYATLLGSRLFPNVDMLATPTKLSTVNSAVYNGELPIPILSTVYHSDDGYHWFEFSPFEAGTRCPPCARRQWHCRCTR